MRFIRLTFYRGLNYFAYIHQEERKRKKEWDTVCCWWSLLNKKKRTKIVGNDETHKTLDVAVVVSSSFRALTRTMSVQGFFHPTYPVGSDGGGGLRKTRKTFFFSFSFFFFIFLTWVITVQLCESSELLGGLKKNYRHQTTKNKIKKKEVKNWIK